MEKKQQYKITYTMSKEDIMTFVSGLHEIQMEMIEAITDAVSPTYKSSKGK